MNTLSISSKAARVAGTGFGLLWFSWRIVWLKMIGSINFNNLFIYKGKYVWWFPSNRRKHVDLDAVDVVVDVVAIMVAKDQPL
jgi:hypothetical protein